jgi:transposase
MFLKKSKLNGRDYLAIVKGYYVPETKNSRVKTIKALGYLEELKKLYPDPIAHFRQVAKEMTQNEEKIKIKIEIDFSAKTENTVKNIGYFPLSQIYHELGLDYFANNTMRYKNNKYDENAVLKMLVYSRIFDPCSKKRTWENRGQFFDKMDFSLDDTYRFLDELWQHKTRLISHLNNKIKHDVSNLYYDVTNYYFEIDEQDELRKKGVSKERRPNPIVGMGLYMDKNGIPLSFDLYPGNTNDCETLLPSMKKMKNELDLDRVIIVADKGLNTHKNIAATILSGNGYVFSQTARGADMELKEYILDGNGYQDSGDGFKIKSRIYPRLITVNGKRTRIDEKQVIFWSADYDRRAKREREEALKKAKKIVENPALLDNYGSRKYVENKNGKSLSLNEKKISDDEKFDGYYAIVTSELEKSNNEIIEIYRGLWKIEESFKIMKSEFETRPVYLSRENHIKAHFLICFISLVILRLLEQKLHYRYCGSHICNAISKSNCSLLQTNIYMTTYCDPIFNILLPELSLKFHSLKEIKKILANTKI